MWDELLAPQPEQVLGVSDLTRRIKRMLEGEFGRIWVQGEVSNLRRQSSGHVYFSLKDDGSQLPCVLFARDAARQNFRLEDGMEVLLLGDISVYEPHGRYQLIAKIAIQSGEGRLQMEFEKLKRKLAAEGLFDTERKAPLPVLPRRIAVITSPSGAALRDFLRILKRRRYGGEVVLFPARVQGREAPAEIRGMLAHAAASPDFDLVVLTRGGGSIEDLWSFNDEALVRAVVDCPVPVISAVGHEIDHVLTDYAADRRAETPSGAAELISSLYLEVQQRMDENRRELLERVERSLVEHRQKIEQLRARMQIIAPQRQVELLGMRLDEFENRLKQAIRGQILERDRNTRQLGQRLAPHHPRARLALFRQELGHQAGRLERAVEAGLRQRKQELAGFERRLSNNSLQSTLQRGYAILQNENGEILDNIEKARAAASIRARLKDGELQLETKAGRR